MLRLCLNLSLALNLVVAACALQVLQHPWLAARQAGAAPLEVPVGGGGSAARVGNRELLEQVRALSRVDFENLDTLADALTALGNRPATMRAIVNAVVDEKLAAKRKALLEIEARRPYWTAGFDTGLLAETLSARRDYHLERDGLLRRALGHDAFLPDEETRQRQRIYWGDIPPEKIHAVERIHRDYADLEASIRVNQFGIEMAEDRATAGRLVREKEGDIRAVLTATEFEGYEVRNSQTARWLRGQLARFGPTEEEFCELFRDIVSAESPSARASEGRTRDINQLLRAAKRVLPPERFAVLEESVRRKTQSP